MTIARQTLYEQGWTTPMSRLSRTYGMSDVGLAKICKQHCIPRPPRGYWSKKSNGKATRRKTLPPVSDPRLEKVYIDPRPVVETGEEPTEADRRVCLGASYPRTDRRR